MTVERTGAAIDVQRAVAVALASLVSSPAFAVEWRIEPTFHTGAELTNNPRLLTDERGDRDESYVGGRAEFASTLTVSSDVASLSARPRFIYADYADDTLLSRKDKYLLLEARRAFESSSWLATANYTSDTTLTSELGLTGLQDKDREHEVISASLAPTWQLSERSQVGLQAAAQDVHYRDARTTGLVDYRYTMAALSAKHALSATVSMGFTASVGELDVETGGQASRDIRTLASVDWQFAEQWQLGAQFGPARTESDIASEPGYLYSMTLARQSLRHVLQLDVKRDVEPTGRGVLVTRDQLGIGGTVHLSPRLRWNLTAQGVRTHDTIDALRYRSESIEYLSLESHLHWQWTETWTVVLSAVSRHLDVGERDADVTGYSINLGLAWNGQAHALSR